MDVTRLHRHAPSPRQTEGEGAPTYRVAFAALALGLCALPLGATPCEVGNALALIATCVIAIRSRHLSQSALALPAAIIAVGWMGAALGPSGSFSESLGRVWALSAVWFVGALVAVLDRRALRALEGIGLVAAAWSALVAVWLWVLGPGTPATGLFSHHLTLAYALVPPLLLAMERRRWWIVVTLCLCTVLTGSTGALHAVCFGAVTAWLARRDRRAAIGAAVVGVLTALVGLLAAGDALYQRAILWSGGAVVATSGGTAPGAWRETIRPVQHHLDPSFEFPFHAHDSFLQLAAESGWASWLALALIVRALWKNAPPWVLGTAVALGLGAMTQDVAGDLEVLRSAILWTTLGLATPRGGNRSHRPTSALSEVQE